MVGGIGCGQTQGICTIFRPWPTDIVQYHDRVGRQEYVHYHDRVGRRNVELIKIKLSAREHVDFLQL